ncbi:MAG: hypothetical protein PWQ87_216 [Candidatus Woesearchaeota archaeon]|nr:hypothetical protein [Candidatus Woesearchaeota archaeon]
MSLIRELKENKEEIPNSLPETILDKYTQEISTMIEERKKKEKEEDNKRLPLSLKKDEEVKERLDLKENKKELNESKSARHRNNELNKEENESKREGKEYKGEHRKERNYEDFSFFKQLEKRFKEEKGQENIKKHLSSNLLKRMKIYHDTLNKGEFFFLDADDIEEKIYRKLIKLKELESEWVVRNEQYQETRQLLLEKEEEIEQNIKELKEMIRNAERFKLFSQRCSEEKGFRLSNATLYSIEELLYELEKMPDEVFSHYANNQKNDFANWIEGVFGLSDLANRLRQTNSKEEMIDAIKNY